MNAPQSVVDAIQEKSDCVKVRARSLQIHYCKAHGCTWDSDRDCCPHEGRMADDAYAASLRAVNPYYEDALRDECEAHRIAAGAADRFRDVLCEVLDLNENPGDVALVARIREAHGKSGPEPRRWRDFITGATAHLERSGLSFKADRALSADHNESERDRPMSADRDHIWTDDHPTCLRCSATPEQMSADVRQNGHPTCSDQTNEGEG